MYETLVVPEIPLPTYLKQGKQKISNTTRQPLLTNTRIIACYLAGSCISGLYQCMRLSIKKATYNFRTCELLAKFTKLWLFCRHNILLILLYYFRIGDVIKYYGKFNNFRIDFLVSWITIPARWFKVENQKVLKDLFTPFSVWIFLHIYSLHTAKRSKIK